MMLHRFDPFADLYRQRNRAVLDADVYRVADQYFVEVDTPGVSLDDIDIELDKKHLTITVERRQVVDEDRTDIARGRATGTFRRRFFLGDMVDSENVEATYENGVLTLSMPVAETAKARKIAIAASSAS